MALLAGTPNPPSFPSGRYTHTNPLRREQGLLLLTTSLPEPLRRAIITAWRHPIRRFDGKEAIQSIHRQRPSDAQLARYTPRAIGWMMLAELEVSRRILEAPLANVPRETRHTLLVGQGVYQRRLYDALAAHIGETAALAEFLRLFARIA
jgi:hypothetical protein